MDIKTAFLRGSEIERDICETTTWSLLLGSRLAAAQMCLMLLLAGATEWKSIVGCDAIVSKADPLFFYGNDDQRVEGVLACHVDDFL